VTRVRYPGLGAIVSIETVGGAEGAERVCAAVRLWSHSTSLGGVESQLERRRRQPGEPASTPDELIRLSVGVEDVEDLWRDLSQALDHAAR
jgi:cystathionine gamma-synthase